MSNLKGQILYHLIACILTMVVIAESITSVRPLGAPLLEEVDVWVLQGDGAGSFQLDGTACTASREGRGVS